MPDFTWRLIVDEGLPGSLNMALDEVLFAAVSQGVCPPVLRFYQWQAPTLSLGYGQDYASSLNAGFCQRAGIAVVRRMTGGRAVIHDRELTYSLVSPEKNGLFPGSIQGNYAVVAEVLKTAMESLGLAVELALGRRSSPSGTRDYRYNACFNSPSVHELVVAGRKISGSAQMRQRGFFLQHGSLPLDMDLGMVVQALSPADRTDSVRRGEEILARKVGWLNCFTREPVAAAQLRERIMAAFSRCLGISFDQREFTPEELDKAHKLRRLKYDTPAWTQFRQVPGAEGMDNSGG